MLENNVEISKIRLKREVTSKNPGFVIAMASSVNGIIFAKSFAKSSLTYDVARTAATSAAEIKSVVSRVIPSAKTNKMTDRTTNQKNVTIGKRMRYSKKYKNAAIIFAKNGLEWVLY